MVSGWVCCSLEVCTTLAASASLTAVAHAASASLVGLGRQPLPLSQELCGWPWYHGVPLHGRPLPHWWLQGLWFCSGDGQSLPQMSAFANRHLLRPGGEWVNHGVICLLLRMWHIVWQSDGVGLQLWGVGHAVPLQSTHMGEGEWLE